MGQKSARSRDRSDHRSTTASQKKQPREESQQKEVESRKYYHWYDESDNIRVVINMGYVRDIIEHEMARLGAMDMHEFLTERGLARVYLWIKEGKSIVSVKILKKFYRIFNIDPDQLEQKGIILSPLIYPVDMEFQGLH